MSLVSSLDHIPDIAEEVKPPFLPTLWEKIKAVIKRIFDFFFTWKSKPPIFTEKQRASIQKAIEERHQKNIEDHQELEVKKIPRKSKPEHTFLKSAEDPALKHLNKFVKDLGPVLVNDCIYHEVIKPEIPQMIDSINQINQTIEPWAKMATTAINAVDPCIEKMNILTSIYIIIEKAKQIVQLLSNKDILDENDISLEWINQSNDLFLKVKDTTQLINLFLDGYKFAKNFASLLEKGEFNKFIEAAQISVTNNLEAGFKELLERNSPRLLKTLSERVDELIYHLPYSKAFDKLIVEAHRHIDAWIQANESVLETKNTIEKAQIITENEGADEDSQKFAKSYIEKVEGEGGKEGYLEDSFIKEYKEAYITEFIDRQKYKREGNSVDPDRLKLLTSNSSENESVDIYNKYAETIYHLLLPTKEAELPLDTSVKLSGVVNLWDICELNRPFTDIFEQINQMIELTIQESDLVDSDIFREYLTVLTKKFLLERIHQRTKGVIAKGVENIFYKLTNPDALEELFADNILPIMINKIIASFAHTLLLRNINQMAPLFETFIDNPDDENRENIISTLFNLMQNNTKEYDLNQDRDKFNSLVNPLIIELSENLLNRLKKDAPERDLSPEEVKEAIIAYFESEKVEPNAEYGEIVMKLLFRMGSFGGGFKEWILSFVKGSVSEGVTLSLKDTQKSYHQLINSAINAMRINYLDRDYLRSTFFSEDSSLEEVRLNKERVKLELPRQIKIVSALIHDVLYENLYANSSWRRPFLYKATPTVETLEGTITNIFNNFFKRELLNKNLLLQGFHVLDKALAKSVTIGNRQQQIRNI